MAERYQSNDDRRGEEHRGRGKERVRYGAGYGDVEEDRDGPAKPGGFSPTLGPWGDFPPHSSSKH